MLVMAGKQVGERHVPEAHRAPLVVRLHASHRATVAGGDWVRLHPVAGAWWMRLKIRADVGVVGVQPGPVLVGVGPWGRVGRDVDWHGWAGEEKEL